MTKKTVSSLRKAFAFVAAALAALAVSLGLPMKKAQAAPLQMRMKTGTAVAEPVADLMKFAPKYVAPSAERLVSIADKALSDDRLAERIFGNPDAVAAEYHLSDNEARVLRQMTREQFETARQDAKQVVSDRLAKAGAMRLPPDGTDVRLITGRMVVGRAILAAVGRSYLQAANAHGCCPWGHAIELGVNSDPAYYNAVFKEPAGMMAPHSGMMMQTPNAGTPAGQQPE